MYYQKNNNNLVCFLRKFKHSLFGCWFESKKKKKNASTVQVFFFNVVVHVARGDRSQVGGCARDWAFVGVRTFIGGDGFGSIRVGSNRCLGFALVIVIYSFVVAKKKVTGEAWTEAVNCIATAAVAANGECRSANVVDVDADVIIVGSGVAGPSNSLSFLFLFFLSRQPNSALSISFFFFWITKNLLKFMDLL